jgi:hypothetical protein
MSSKPTVVELQAASAQPTSEETRAQDLFNRQKAYFAKYLPTWDSLSSGPSTLT